MNASIHSKTEYPFDYFFEKTAGPSSEGEESPLAGPSSEGVESPSSEDVESPSAHCDVTTASDCAKLDSTSDSELQ